MLVQLPPLARAQTADTSTLHATIRGWSERTWLLLLDRGAAKGGRLSTGGFLQRFDITIDEEHQIDLVSAQWGLTEEYAWQRAEHGARYWAGSVNHLRLITGGSMKTAVTVADGWQAQVRFDKEELPTIDRNLLRVAVRRDWNSGPYAFIDGSLFAVKPDMDLGVGAGVRHEQLDVRVSITALDIFNDVIYQGLKVHRVFADTALDYERHPVALRSSATWQPFTGVRIEAEGALLLPSRVRAYRQVAPDSGFRQHERFGFASGLVEYAVSPRLTIGVLGTYVRAATDRTPLALGEPTDDYALIEQTGRLGGYVLADLGRRWRTESWVLREWRPEWRDFRTDAAPDVDYEDRSWVGTASVEYRAPAGFRAHGAFEMDLRDTVKGDGQVPRRSPLGTHNTRLRFDLGWSFDARVVVLAGYRVDLDRDPLITVRRPWFDGAHGRFVMYW